MEDTKSKTKDMKEKGCGCFCHHRHTNSAFRFVMTLLVIMVAFWCGLKLGELRGYIYSMQSQKPVRFYMTEYKNDRPSKTEPVLDINLD